MAAPLRVSLRRTEADADGRGSVVMSLPSDVGQVGTAVELMVDHCFSGLSPSSRVTFRLRVALAEALANAIVRGNHEDPAKQVVVRAELFAESIRLEVADEGPGFAWAEPFAAPRPESLDDERGRGLFIIRSLADQVEFNEQGNTIWMTLPRC